jgi:hypothetical protein
MPVPKRRAGWGELDRYPSAVQISSKSYVMELMKLRFGCRQEISWGMADLCLVLSCFALLFFLPLLARASPLHKIT